MNNVRKVRREKDITQERLAELVQSSKGYICDLERGIVKNPSLGKARLIAYQLSSTLDEVFPK